MSELYGKAGEKTFKALLSDPNGADVITVPCTPGKGVIAAGTVLARQDNGLYSPAAAADVTETAYLAVAGEEVDTGSEATGTAEDMTAYRAGRFAADAVILADKSAPTAALQTTLRKQGIVFDQTQEATGFDNSAKT